MMNDLFEYDYADVDDAMDPDTMASAADTARKDAKTQDAPARPQPGDAIRLDGHYYAGPVGTMFTIDGDDYGSPDSVMAVMNASAFRAVDRSFQGMLERRISGSKLLPGGITVSCSGGPCPMVKLADLTYVGTHLATFWRWLDGISGAGRGDYYQLEVPLWSWTGGAKS